MNSRTSLTLARAACLPWAVLLAMACSDVGDPGGESESGGSPPSGGNVPTGGTNGEGGLLAGGGTSSGGATRPTGGSPATGGAATTGGVPAGGGPSGGVSTGGVATGGTTTGGTTTGGVATGGVATGGTATGGTATGGVATGGAETGGAETGGAETGGAETGGAETGGAETGGAETGGAETGGAATGGDGGTGGASDVVPSSGCGKPPTLTSGSHTLQSGGEERSYILSIPDNYDNTHPYRLVFAFHWNGGTANDIESGGSDAELWSYYGLRNQAEDSTIFVAPQGIGNGWANSGGRDLTFVDAMVDQIEGDLCVDTTRLFSVGFSYGGGMSFALACDRATVFRGVAVYSGWELSGCADGTQPVAYLGIHGIGDGTCTIPGGRTLRDTFVTNNGCTPQSPPEPSSGSLTHTCTSYEGCDSGYPVRWCAFDGGHTPGPVDGGGDSGARTWTKGEVWDFFTQF